MKLFKTNFPFPSLWADAVLGVRSLTRLTSRIVVFVVILLLFVYFFKTILTYLLFYDWFSKPSRFQFVNNTFNANPFYSKKYKHFFNTYTSCNNNNFSEIPYLTKDDLIRFNDKMITPPYKKCNLTCTNSCINDPLWYDSKCAVGQSTGGTSGKSTFVWMNKYDGFNYIKTFVTSFKKNGYVSGDKGMIFYPSNSYFTNEYEKSNYYLRFLNAYFLSFKQIDREKTVEFVNSINEERPNLIVIFPFVLLQLCINIRKYNLTITHFPRNINLSGEYLLNCSLHFCKQIFVNSNIESTYGAVEFGEIAHQVAGDKNTFEVFDQFCYLENKDDKIVVTSLINPTFPIIRYVMEDVGQIVNKNGKQYITNLIGKNTNQIIVSGQKFTSIDVDKLVDEVNISDNIISIVMKYDEQSIDINYIVVQEFSPENQQTIVTKTNTFMDKYFKRMRYNIRFVKEYKHDYLKKFKIIVKKNNTDTEPVGGFYKY